MTDEQRAIHLRSAEHHIRQAVRDILEAQVPDPYTSLILRDIHKLKSIASNVDEYAEVYEWKEVDRK